MNVDRMIEILAEVSQLKVETIKTGIEQRVNKFPLRYVDALTAMQRAVEKETARLKQCEAIVRELAERPHRRGREHPHIIDYIKVIDTARQWVENNPK